jgi:hypothetical protein
MTEEISVGGFRYEVGLVRPEDVRAGDEISLAGRNARHRLMGFKVPVDWESERLFALITNEPELGSEGLWQFTDGHRLFVASPGWPLLLWKLLG